MRAEESFNLVKQKLTGTPVLAFFDPRKSIELYVDSSSVGIGCVLVQENRTVLNSSTHR